MDYTKNALDYTQILAITWVSRMIGRINLCGSSICVGYGEYMVSKRRKR